jgi:hypothetical protein
MIDELDAKCSFVDCEHKSQLKNMIHHEKNLCEFRDVPCDHCNEPVIFNKLAEHKEICEFRPMPCEYCDLKFKSDMMVHHLETTCVGVERTCPDGCSAMITIPMFASHAAECMEHKVPCSWAHYGCSDLIPRKDLEAHQQDIQYHVSKAITQATTHKSIGDIAWPPTLNTLMSLTGEYFVPQHQHALKLTPHLYTINSQGGLLKNSCNVKAHSGCTGCIERIPGLPMQDRSGRQYFFAARCECCDFDVCILCLINNHCLPSRGQLKAMELKYTCVPLTLSNDVAASKHDVAVAKSEIIRHTIRTADHAREITTLQQNLQQQTDKITALERLVQQLSSTIVNQH